MQTSLTTEIKEELAPRLRWAVTRLARRLRQEAGADLGPSQTAALATVERPGPLSPSELAEIERIRGPAVPRIVRHLEQASLIERVTDPQDGRASILSVTAEGRALLRRLRERKNGYLDNPRARPGAQDGLT